MILSRKDTVMAVEQLISMVGNFLAYRNMRFDNPRLFGYWRTAEGMGRIRKIINNPKIEQGACQRKQRIKDACPNCVSVNRRKSRNGCSLGQLYNSYGVRVPVTPDGIAEVRNLPNADHIQRLASIFSDVLGAGRTVCSNCHILMIPAIGLHRNRGSRRMWFCSAACLREASSGCFLCKKKYVKVDNAYICPKCRIKFLSNFGATTDWEILKAEDQEFIPLHTLPPIERERLTRRLIKKYPIRFNVSLSSNIPRDRKLIMIVLKGAIRGRRIGKSAAKRVHVGGRWIEIRRQLIKSKMIVTT